MANRTRIEKTLAGTLIAAAIALATYWLFLHNFYANTLPRTPQVAVSRVVPLNVHGTIVYLTDEESSGLTWLFVGALAFGACGGALWKRASQ